MMIKLAPITAIAATPAHRIEIGVSQGFRDNCRGSDPVPFLILLQLFLSGSFLRCSVFLTLSSPCFEMDGERNDQERILSLDDTSENQLTPCSDYHSKAKGRIEPVPELSVSPEKRHNASCENNLRKSLAWNSAFFTSEGVLDPEELADVNQTFRKVYISSLPGIQEEARRSADSSGTLDSDIWADENIENQLFGNIRASIQRYQLKRNENLPPSCRSRTFERGKIDVAGTIRRTPPSQQSSVRYKKATPRVQSSPHQLAQKSAAGSTEVSPPIRKNARKIRRGMTCSPETPARSSSLLRSSGPCSSKGSSATRTLINKNPSHPSPGRSTPIHRRGNAALAGSFSSGTSSYSSTDSAAADPSSSSVKPSGLRLPSPKMGYFDAGKSLPRTRRVDQKQD